MPVEIIMPELGESVHEGTLTRWLKKEGEHVKEDEAIVEIMTDKVNTELPSPATGVLHKILIQEGSPVEVFTAMGLILKEGEVAQGVSAPKPTTDSSIQQMSVPQIQSTASLQPTNQTQQNNGRKWYTPLVRSMAKEHSITEDQLGSIRGSGEGGRVTKKDLETLIQAGTSTGKSLQVAKVETSITIGADQTTQPLTGMRKMIAEAMVRSAAVPTVSTLTDVDVTQMVLFRENNKDSFQSQYGVKLTYTPFFIKAIAEALVEYPYINASLQNSQIIMNSGVHVGVAVALGPKGDQGLIVPAIRDCHKKTLIDIARDLDSIAKKARSNQLSVADVQGATFTLTNPGTYGAILGTPMINAPQAGILGAYAIKKQPVVINDMIAIRSIMNIVLTYDHRIVDGMLAGKFLQSIKNKLENFEFFK